MHHVVYTLLPVLFVFNVVLTAVPLTAHPQYLVSFVQSRPVSLAAVVSDFTA